MTSIYDDEGRLFKHEDELWMRNLKVQFDMFIIFGIEPILQAELIDKQCLFLTYII